MVQPALSGQAILPQTLRIQLTSVKPPGHHSRGSTFNSHKSNAVAIDPGHNDTERNPDKQPRNHTEATGIVSGGPVFFRVLP